MLLFSGIKSSVLLVGFCILMHLRNRFTIYEQIDDKCTDDKRIELEFNEIQNNNKDNNEKMIDC